MKVEKKEIVETNVADTKFGKVREWSNGLGLSIEQNTGLKVTIMEDSLVITLPVSRPGHDHNDISQIRIDGLMFVRPEGSCIGHYAVKTPKIEISTNYTPRFVNPEEIRFRLMSNLEDAVGKQYGETKDGFILHAYPVENTCSKCLTILGRQNALDELYKLIGFKEQMRKRGKMS